MILKKVDFGPVGITMINHSFILLVIVLSYTTINVFAFNHKVSTDIMKLRSTIETKSKNAVLANAIKNNKSSLKAIIQGVGDEGCELPSPSRINTLSLPLQFASFLGVSATIYIATRLSIAGFDQLDSMFPFYISLWKKSFPILGIIYLAAGVAHFKIREEFENIYPKVGAWGFWYLPGSKKFHVEWTGVAEMIGGLWLLIGGIADIFGLTLPAALGPHVLADGALWLLVLTILVTPANIYMLTHGARLPKDGPEIPIKFHMIRLAVQCILFTQFYELAIPSINAFLK